ncbi:hypothetical protein LNKW23_22730 [Paralimibaculum aggregatum]|uniref:Uncharacterized protein n=1 Tax=Paralimibaculum aggregatum TaxID=3036245 RepID=A0ABQ6LLA2_9RHOB|nr:hypothetical protein [Limibaculum sp. NKW23]GMG83060.1 hypothetical protein LNKW23_22730 [Limibaculum sp. NKW23]
MSAPADPRPRGGAPVGYLAELSEVETAAVLAMRLWCAGETRQAQLWTEFATLFGTRDGAAHLKGLEQMMVLIAGHSRRPVMRHRCACRCLGADEAVLARMIGAAAEGNRDEAALFAALLVRVEMATLLAAEAEVVAATLRLALMRGSGLRAEVFDPPGAPETDAAETHAAGTDAPGTHAAGTHAAEAPADIVPLAASHRAAPTRH